jgi:hypothetical protein
MRGLTVALVLIACAPTRAGAEEDAADKAQARLLLSQGNTLFEKGDLRGALVDFRAAYRLYPSPKLLVNAAAAERELGDLAGAATDLRHFIDDAPEDDPFLVDRARTDLRALEKRVARVGISIWPKGSTLEIDGRQGRDPTYVRPGLHSLRVRAPSGAQLERDAELAAGQTLEVELVAAARVAAPPPPPPPSHGNRRGLIIGLSVTAGALVIAGAVIGIVLGTQSSAPALKGDLGTVPFSIVIRFR